MRWSLRYRLLMPLLLLLGAVVGLSYWSGRRAAHEAESRIAGQVRGITQALTRGGFSPTRGVLERMKEVSGADYVSSGEGEESLTTLAADPDSFDLSAAIETNQPGLGRRLDVHGEFYFVSRLDLSPGRTIYILYPEAERNKAIDEAIRPSLWLGLVGVLAVILTAILGQRIVRRIRDLQRRTQAIAAGDFSPMVAPRVDDELRDLTLAVNEMAAKLATMERAIQRTERLRIVGRVSAGLAHQVRNVATGARLAMQVHADECPIGDSESLAVTLRQLELLESTLRRFINAGRDEGQEAPKAVNPAEVVRESIGLLEPMAKHLQIRMDSTIDDRPAIVQAEPMSLQDLVLNLLSNALEAAGPNGWVEVNIGLRESSLILEISDSGPGPPSELTPRLFEPFVTGKPDGVGLGLVVAKQAAESSGGRIGWERRADRTIFRVVWPAESLRVAANLAHG